MASDYTVCVMANQKSLAKIAEAIRQYDSEEIKSLIQDTEAEWQLPTGVYLDTIEVTENAVWFDARRACNDMFFKWIASKSTDKMMYAYYDDCGNDVYYASIMSGANIEYLGSIDAFKFYKSEDQKSLWEKEFITLMRDKLALNDTEKEVVNILKELEFNGWAKD